MYHQIRRLTKHIRVGGWETQEETMITLDNETVFLLKTLYTQISVEMSKPALECNIDIVTENQYKILDTIKDVIFEKRNNS